MYQVKIEGNIQQYNTSIMVFARATSDLVLKGSDEEEQDYALEEGGDRWVEEWVLWA